MWKVRECKVGLNQHSAFDLRGSVQMQLLLTLYINNLFIKEVCP